MKLVINDIEIELYPYCKLEYLEELDTTHLFFDYYREEEYLAWVDQVCDVLDIHRFKHDLGIVFGNLSVYWPGKTPPNNISIIE